MKKFRLTNPLLIITLSISVSFCTDKSGDKTDIIEVAQSNLLWTGVAVSEEGRIFVNYPRWSEGVEISVAEIIENGEVVAFPNEEWNEWDTILSTQDYFVCVQSVYIDDENFLWILDPANPMFRGVIGGGAKLLKIDLLSNQVIQKIIFDSTTAPSFSYLNDVRVDTELNYAYITDSGLGAILVVNLDNGKSHRVLNEHHSTKAENITLIVEGRELKLKVHSDGLALNPTRDYLYYQALTGKNLYRIKTEFLRDVSMSESKIGNKVEFVAKTGVVDAIAFGQNGNLYLTSLEFNAIRKYTPEGDIEMVVQSSSLKWPDSFSITNDGTIYVTTSQLHLGNSIKEPYRIFKLIQ